MNNFFAYNSSNGQVELAVPEILLIKEFSKLIEPSRNKCKEDPEGKFQLRAFREFTYIYLAIHWQSPYADYYEQERHEQALKDAKISEQEWEDLDFRAACRKFKELQESHKSVRLLKSAKDTVDKLVFYFENIDPEERDPLTGKPIFAVKNIIAELTSLHKVHEELQILESNVKKEIAEASVIRGGAVDGFLPNF